MKVLWRMPPAVSGAKARRWKLLPKCVIIHIYIYIYTHIYIYIYIYITNNTYTNLIKRGLNCTISLRNISGRGRREGASVEAPSIIMINVVTMVTIINVSTVTTVNVIVNVMNDIKNSYITLLIQVLLLLSLALSLLLYYE